MSTPDEIRSIADLFATVKSDTDRLLAARGHDAVGPQTANIIAAQNTLRSCMETVFAQCLPYDEKFLAEMAVRLAAYAISAAPVEAHAALAQAVSAAIPQAVQRRVRDGVVIRTQWGPSDGIASPNIPSKGDVQ